MMLSQRKGSVNSAMMASRMASTLVPRWLEREAVQHFSHFSSDLGRHRCLSSSFDLQQVGIRVARLPHTLMQDLHAPSTARTDQAHRPVENICGEMAPDVRDVELSVLGALSEGLLHHVSAHQLHLINAQARDAESSHIATVYPLLHRLSSGLDEQQTF